MMAACQHLDHIDVVTPSGDGCKECLEVGDSWVHLRLCMSCGHVGCCDNSKNKHATKHFGATRHPIIMSYEPGEAWGWCYVERGYFDSLPDIMEELGKPAPPMR
jgi:uncharacterized UBP type Zn finger protein